MTTTTLTAPPQQQGIQGTEQALGSTADQIHRYQGPRPPSEEVDAFRGLVDALLLALPFWLIVALLIAVV